MNGLEYEKYCAGWLKRHGYHDISLTRATGDQGIDILACRHGKQYGFQCKYYDRPVGNEAVQQAYSGAAFYDCDVSAVITNNTFTRSAVQLADEIDVVLLDQIDPKTEKPLFTFKQILSVIISFIGIFNFSQYSRHPLMAFNDLGVWSDIALVTGGLSGMYAENHLFLCFLAMILDLSYLLLNLNVLHQSESISAVILWCLVLLLTGGLSIHFIRMLRKRNRQNMKRLRHEIREEITSQVYELGKHLESLLQEELHCTVTLQSARHRSDGTSSFVFHSSRDVTQDLALLEYSFNQYAKHDHIADHYTFTSEGSRSFTLVIARESDN